MIKTLIETPSGDERTRKARLTWIAYTLQHVFVALPHRVRRLGSCPPCTVTVYDTVSGKQRCISCHALY